MKLFVDDTAQAPEGWVLAKTNTEAIQKILTGFVQEISLDHDIGSSFNDPEGDQYGEPTGETFMPVVAILINVSPSFRPKRVFVHTRNSVARKNMANMLEIVGYEVKVVSKDHSQEYLV